MPEVKYHRGTHPARLTHLEGNPGANRKSISHRCYLREVAFVWRLTTETMYLPLGCHQGGFVHGAFVREFLSHFVKRFQGWLVSKAHRRLHHPTLGSRVVDTNEKKIRGRAKRRPLSNPLRCRARRRSSRFEVSSHRMYLLKK